MSVRSPPHMARTVLRWAWLPGRGNPAVSERPCIKHAALHDVYGLCKERTTLQETCGLALGNEFMVQHWADDFASVMTRPLSLPPSPSPGTSKETSVLGPWVSPLGVRGPPVLARDSTTVFLILGPQRFALETGAHAAYDKHQGVHFSD